MNELLLANLSVYEKIQYMDHLWGYDAKYSRNPIHSGIDTIVRYGAVSTSPFDTTATVYNPAIGYRRRKTPCCAVPQTAGFVIPGGS
jgi:hypothetical protein